MSDTAQRIRQAVTDVARLRQDARGIGGLAEAVLAVKRFQGRRFAGTYADLLSSSAYSSAARFFLEELYSDKDFAERDQQFARIAGAVEKFFPADVALTAVTLAELHALTESFDHAMGHAILPHPAGADLDPDSYVRAWRVVGRRAEREAQLRIVLAIGDEMSRLTRLPGLRFMLKMMRGPASAAGLSSLQRFLETGFDTFSGMSRRPGGAEAFLQTIRSREQQLIVTLFDADPVASGTELAQALGQAR